MLESSTPSLTVPVSARVGLPKELLRNADPTDRAFRFVVTLITMAKTKARTIEVTQDKLAEAMQCSPKTVYLAMEEAKKFYGLTMHKWTTPDKKQHIRYDIPRFRGGVTYVQKHVVYGMKADCDLRAYLVVRSADFKVKTKYVERKTAWFADMLGLTGKTAERTALKRLRRLGPLLIPRHTGGSLAVKGVVKVSTYDEYQDLTKILQGLENGTSDDGYTRDTPGPQMTDISTLSNDKKEKDWQLQEKDPQPLTEKRLKIVKGSGAAWPEVVIPGSGGMRAPNLDAPKSLWRREGEHGSGSGSGAVSGS